MGLPLMDLIDRVTGFTPSRFMVYIYRWRGPVQQGLMDLIDRANPSAGHVTHKGKLSEHLNCNANQRVFKVVS